MHLCAVLQSGIARSPERSARLQRLLLALCRIYELKTCPFGNLRDISDALSAFHRASEVYLKDAVKGPSLLVEAVVSRRSLYEVFGLLSE